jgi:hypothetical protein
MKIIYFRQWNIYGKCNERGIEEIKVNNIICFMRYVSLPHPKNNRFQLRLKENNNLLPGTAMALSFTTKQEV